MHRKFLSGTGHIVPYGPQDELEHADPYELRLQIELCNVRINALREQQNPNWKLISLEYERRDQLEHAISSNKNRRAKSDKTPTDKESRRKNLLRSFFRCEFEIERIMASPDRQKDWDAVDTFRSAQKWILDELHIGKRTKRLVVTGKPPPAEHRDTLHEPHENHQHRLLPAHHLLAAEVFSEP
ncbi:hypothetical protein NO2_1731 [Candidatus Termititenax persephonae]|uniref:Uncharacterized protein n=1 Tax=Candidatus Termititenax persephonae TaxID=2218525 RepID=A0A388TKE7_9BACT|nr:hypothetical protein NO2_1731 [Candidatus Termititenax persephonae]